MNNSEIDKIVEKLNLKNVVSEALKKAKIENNINDEILSEAYVSEPKTYEQVTEFVTEKTKNSHKQLYNQYIDRLNRISSKLDSVNKSIDAVNSSHSDFRSLKLDETYNANAKWLHELYFANCFAPYSEIAMNSLSYIKLQQTFGTFDDFQKEFIACALSCGNGWAVCAYNMHLKRYVNTFISHDSGDVQVGLYPILVLDCWEHSYYRDYLTDKISYIIAMMREINWEIVEERVEKAEKIAKVL